MPDTLSLSTGVSLGLLAGIVSGVCYLVANGLTWSSGHPRSKFKRVDFELGMRGALRPRSVQSLPANSAGPSAST
ncbi:hypothetical protein EVAR_83314_1 [Eumeta japonica]|uniref:Uncharacterized protein n=1 Tax=Eumeta variegata TaxID=151549 RepID=A0A4C1VY86_EUMVA|nr:hypothetical protein EVAR_83314_1 [Eumeta japonica]